MVLLFDVGVHFFDEYVEGLLEGAAVGVDFVVAVFNALEDAGDADFYEFVEVAGGDGEEFDAFEERIGGVFCLFEHAAIEFEPGGIAAVEKLRLGGGSATSSVLRTVFEVYSVSPRGRILSSWIVR